jgi:hypothetical protein
VTREDMAKGMALLSTAFNRPLTAELMEVFHSVLGPRLSAGRWERAVLQALEKEAFFPAPAVLLRHGTADDTSSSRAVEAFESILSCYAGGHHLDARDVAAQFGMAARDAFLAAGGRATFDAIGGEGQERARSFALRDFTATWKERVLASPTAAISSGEERADLEAGAPNANSSAAVTS